MLAESGPVRRGGVGFPRFTDQESDRETDLMYYGARYYDPWVGRFLSQDPALIGPYPGVTFGRIEGDSQNLNAYTYVLNRPTTLTDPTGAIVPCADYAACTAAGYNGTGGGLSAGGRPGSASFSKGGNREMVAAATGTSDSEPASRGEALLANRADRAKVAEGLLEARNEVVRRAEFGSPPTNTTIGAALKRQIGRSRAVAGQPRGLIVTEVSENVVRGLEEKGGGFVHNLGPITNAEAIAVSLPVFAREALISARAGKFEGLSAQLGGVPVFVVAPKDGAIILFEAGLEPRGVSFR